MVVLRRASGVLLVALVVMATTIAHETPVVDKAKDAASSLGHKAKDAATSVGDKAKDAATSVGHKAKSAATSVGDKAKDAAASLGVTRAKGGGTSCDVKEKGAKGDGKTDDSAAFATAWRHVCAVGGTIIVPKGEYLVETIEFKGPCKGPVTFELNGNLKAPAEVKPNKPHCGWINFMKICDFTLIGNGAIFDGQGAEAWKVNDCKKTGKCNTLPINIRFTGLTNSKIKGITSTNSKLFHMNILNCNNVTLEDIGIDAPPESPNTDGIHFGRSHSVNLIGAKIKTGDDCISIGDGNENLVIENVECGPGHGISIGSLGKYPNEQPVKGITVRKSIIRNTDNGVRIKTWPGSPPGHVSNVVFEDIKMENVSLPVLIDQVYCPHGHCKAGASQVKLSDLTIKNITGTSATKIAVKLMCSKGCPCANVNLADINLVHDGKEGPAVSACANIKPVVSGKVVPAPCTEVANPNEK